MGQVCTEFPIVHKIKLVVLSPGHVTKISYVKSHNSFFYFRCLARSLLDYSTVS